MNDVPRLLKTTYEQFHTLVDALPAGETGDFVADQLGEACNCILRVLHETDQQAYMECVVWAVGRMSCPSAVEV